MVFDAQLPSCTAWTPWTLRSSAARLRGLGEGQALTRILPLSLGAVKDRSGQAGRTTTMSVVMHATSSGGPAQKLRAESGRIPLHQRGNDETGAQLLA